MIGLDALRDPVNDALRAGRVAFRSGLLTPRRPDRPLRAAAALHHFGTTLGGESAAAAALYGNRAAVIDESRFVGYVSLHTRTNALAHGFVAQGITGGTTVGVVARNDHRFLELTIALAKLGAHVVLLNTSMSAPQLTDVSAREHIEVVIHDDELAPLVTAMSAQAIPISQIDELISSRTTAAPPRPERAGRIVILTSGTTGTPKGAQRTVSTPIGAALGMLDAIPYRGGEPMLIAAPLFHSWGFSHVTIALALGSPIVLQRRFEPEAVLAAIERHEVAVLVAVPVMLHRLIELPADVRARYDLSGLRLVPLSGSAIPAGLAERFMDAYGDIVYNLYGSTEAGVVTVAAPADLRAAPGTAGRAPGGIEVHILDDAGKPVAPGATGRIVVRSPLVFDGYTDGDTKPAVDGAMQTGDTGHLDDRGRLFVDGRDDDMVVSGGENVYPREVEDLLAAHPGVEEAAVVGVPDTEFGTRLAAYVVRRSSATDLDENTLREHVRTHLARYKVPRDVTFVDSLPRNATGKVVKHHLR